MTKRRNDDDEDDFKSKKDPLKFTVTRRVSHTFRVKINEEIKAPSYYEEIFDLLLEAGEEDVIQFLIESPGGRIDGLNTLLMGIQQTDAHVVAVIVGECHSAASLLALNCHDVAVCEGAHMLCHSIRLGFGGKMPDLVDYTEHQRKIGDALFRQTYEGFLSDEELERVLDGKELWLDADQIKERLEARAAYFTEEEEDAKTERTPDVQPANGGSKGKKVRKTSAS